MSAVIYENTQIISTQFNTNITFYERQISESRNEQTLKTLT